jgi:hypothetical protein
MMVWINSRMILIVLISRHFDLVSIIRTLPALSIDTTSTNLCLIILGLPHSRSRRSPGPCKLLQMLDWFAIFPAYLIILSTCDASQSVQ